MAKLTTATISRRTWKRWQWRRTRSTGTRSSRGSRLSVREQVLRGADPGQRQGGEAGDGGPARDRDGGGRAQAGGADHRAHQGGRGAGGGARGGPGRGSHRGGACAPVLEEHVAVRCKPRTVEMYTLIVRKHLLPALGRVPALAVDHKRVTERHHSMRGTPSMANRTVEALSCIWNSAEDRGELPEASNPCRVVAKNRERGRERFLSEDEFRRLGRALAEAETGNGVSVHAVAAIRLLLLTGLRRNEVLALRWRDVDLDARELRLADSKTGARVAPLSPEAARVLAGIPRVEGNPHVIPGKKAGTHLRNLNDPWDRIRRRAKLEDVRLHDCRHSFASRALALGEGLTMIGKLLGHTKVETTARYAHLARESVRESAIRISNSIAADILKGCQVDGGDEAPAGTAA